MICKALHRKLNIEQHETHLQEEQTKTMAKRRRTDNTMSKRRRTDNTMAKRRKTDNTMAKRRRTDNTMAKRRRTDHTMATRRRTENAMSKRKGTKGQETIEDTKGVIRSRKSRDGQYNGQKKMTTNNDLQSTIQKTKDRATPDPLTTGRITLAANAILQETGDFSIMTISRI